jgi:capsular exopolysaccharide synthesis family protein
LPGWLTIFDCRALTEGWDVDLREYLHIVAKQWWLILLAGLLGLGAALGIALTSTKVYTARAQIFVATASATDILQLAQGNTFTEARVQSYVSIADSPAVTDAVVRDLGLSITSAQLASQISASAPADTVLIDIAVRSGSPLEAARLANAVAVRFTLVVADLEVTSRSGQSAVRLTVTHPATAPVTPTSPRTRLDLVLGLLLGLAAGFGLAVVRKTLNSSVGTPEDLERVSGAPVLAVVGYDKRAGLEPISFRADRHGPRAEAFRQLRTNLQFINIDRRPRTIAVTSCLTAEGKSMIALNLASALAEAGFSVCLVEADLRRPTIATTLGLVRDVGLTTVLIGQASVDEVIQGAGENLSVITSGPIPPNPSELLVSEQARAVLAEIANRAYYTIIDSAPLLAVADAAEIAALADATLLVVRSGRTTRNQVTRAIEVLARVNERPVGCILNMARTRGTDGYLYTYDGAYRPDRQDSDAQAPTKA